MVLFYIMRYKIPILFLAIIVFNQKCTEGLPIYSDYLTDNYYLLFLLWNAGCSKIRYWRQQWVDQINPKFTDN